MSIFRDSWYNNIVDEIISEQFPNKKYLDVDKMRSDIVELCKNYVVGLAMVVEDAGESSDNIITNVKNHYHDLEGVLEILRIHNDITLSDDIYVLLQKFITECFYVIVNPVLEDQEQ